MVMTTQENANNLPGSTKSANIRDNNPEMIAKIEQSFAQGYRLYTAKEFENAAEELAKTNIMSVDTYGQFAPECFKPHYYYGLCMLEIAQTKAQNQLLPIIEENRDEENDQEEEDEGVAEKDEDNEGMADEDNEAEAAADKQDNVAAVPAEKRDSTEGQSSTKAEADSPTKMLKEDEENVEKSPTKSTNKEDSDHSDKVVSTTDDESKAEDKTEKTLDSEAGEDNKDDDEDDIPADRLAWESLEVARKICEKMEDSATSEWAERRAEVLSALSDCLILTEQYDLALAELNTALSIQKRFFKPHDRRIAETYYNIGRCHRNADDFEKAATAFQEAGRQLQGLIDHITEQGEAATEDEKETAASLAVLIKEIEENVKDALESAETRTKQLAEQRTMVTSMFSDILGANKPVDDITGLVTRRPKKISNGDSSKSEVPTNSAGAASTTSTTTDHCPETKATKTTDVHTGAEIEMEEPAAAGDVSAASVPSVKRTAGDSDTPTESKKVKLSGGEENEDDSRVTESGM